MKFYLSEWQKRGVVAEAYAILKEARRLRRRYGAAPWRVKQMARLKAAIRRSESLETIERIHMKGAVA